MRTPVFHIAGLVRSVRTGTVMIFRPRFGMMPALLVGALLCTRTSATNIVWTNLAGGNWNVTNNWVPHQLPGTNDTAWITNNGTYTVTLNANVTLAGLVLGGTSGIQTLSHVNFSLILDGPGGSSANGVYALASGTLDGSGTLTLAGPFNWTGGTLGSTGSTLVVQANGGVTISGGISTFLGGTLVNGGAGSWSAGQINCYNTALFSNAPAGTFDLTIDGTAFSFTGGAPLLVNAGTLRKTAGTGTSTVSLACNNSGSVLVQTGTLNLSRGGASSGQFSNSIGTTLSFGGGTHTLLGGSTVNGPGSVSVGAVAGLVVEGAMAAGALTNNGTLDFDSLTTDYITNLTLSAGTLNGTNSTVVTGPFNWTGGSLGSASSTLVVQANGGVTISGGISTFLGGTLINGGPGSWSAGQINLGGTALFSNAPAGTFDFTADGSSFVFANGTPLLVNAGTLRKTAGTGTSTVSVACNNSGLIQVQTGTLNLSRGGASSGQFSNSIGTTLSFGGGTHTLLGTSGVSGPGSVSVGTTGSLLVQGAMAVGALTNNGTLDFDSLTTDYITNLTLSAGTLDGTNSTVVTGPFNWTGGTLGSTGSTLVVQANGGVTIGGSGIGFFGGTLVNGGAGSWSAGQINCYNTALFSNAPAGTFDFTADGSSFVFANGTPLLANAGTLRKTGGTGTSTVSVACNNSGLVLVQTGTLNLSRGGASSGQFSNSIGTTLSFGGGTHTLLGTSGVSGPGSVSVGAVAGLVVEGAMAVGALTNNGTLNFDSLTTDYITNLTLSAGTLDGTNSTVVTGPFNWTGGSLGSAGSTLVLEANGGVTIGGSGIGFFGGTLVNGGAGSWSAGQINCYNTALFSNAPAGTFDFTTDGSAFAFAGGTPLLANAGTLRKTAGTGTSTVSVACNNSGLVLVQTGTLNLSRGGASSGQFSNSIGATLSFGGGTHTLLGTSGVSGPGSVSVSTTAGLLVEGAMAVGALTNNGTLNFDSLATDYITNLTLSAGALDGTNSTVVTGPFNWTGGTLGSTGSTLVVAANGGVTIGGSGIGFFGGTLVNGGAGSWSAGQINCYNTALFSNAPAGTFDFTADGTAFAFAGGTPLLVNAGTLRKTAGTGTSTVSVACNNSGSVQVNSGKLAFGSFIQNGGQTVLNGGNLSFTQTAELLGGTLSGNGTVMGSVSNSAAVSPGASPGLLTISGDYTQTANAHLQIALGGTTAGTQYDQLSVGGTAKLAGSLDISYWNGFTPVLGDVFTVLVCNVRSGGFDTITGPTNTLATVYTARTVLVEPGNAPPTARLQVDLTPTACHTFVLSGSGTDPDGSVTNVTLLLGTNVLVSTAGSSAQATLTNDFPGELTFTALATDNKGAQGATNVVVTITPLPLRVLDPIGFQTNRAFKLCMCGEDGTNYEILSRDDLSMTNWTVLGTMESTNGIWRYFDGTATNSTHRYYRAQQLP